MIEISEIRRYPIKSMRGEPLSAAAVNQRGIDGDRCWAARFADGRIGSGKSWQHVRRINGLLQFSASLSGGRVSVRIPDGRVMPGDSEALRQMLSALAGEDIVVAPETGVTHFDIAPLHVVTEGTLDALTGLSGLPRSSLVDRLRPNLILAGDTRDGPAHISAGSTLALGPGVVIAVTGPTERCVMTTLAQAGLDPARDLLKVIVRELGSCAGFYAEVIRTGIVRPGNRVDITPAAQPQPG